MARRTEENHFEPYCHPRAITVLMAVATLFTAVQMIAITVLYLLAL